MCVVSLSLAKAYLNRTGLDDDDELLQLFIDAAESWLGNYIGKPLADLDPMPDDLKRAVLLLVAFYFDQREAVAYGIAGQIAPFGVTAIADSYRKQWFGEPEPEAATDGD